LVGGRALALAEAAVPKISVMTRKASGGAYDVTATGRRKAQAR
jgi:acetyl-CoA carboxylase carboxyltransferase component